jgi:hypothetical protein
MKETNRLNCQISTGSTLTLIFRNLIKGLQETWNSKDLHWLIQVVQYLNTMELITNLGW